MAEREITNIFSNAGSRNAVRWAVVNAFSNEEPGTGKGENASKYIYYVETLKDGNRVFLKRPAFLHYGFDFVVCVENTNYAAPGERVRNNPRHNDIGNDLKMKKEREPEKYARLFALLERVYNCEDVADAQMDELEFAEGLPVDHILKVTKWLFIEQDIRYWNYSGRNMTWGVIPKP